MGKPPSRRRAAVLASVLILCGTATSAALAAERNATHTVTISATSFQPPMLTVKRGETVVWVNKDPFPHTATAAGDFDSGSIKAGGSWKHRFAKAGDHPYTCTLHPNMKGTIRVE